MQTADNGADSAHALAVFGTGCATPITVTALAQDPAGNRIPLRVEFAGAAPGFFGLDQVNVLLPPEIDGAGTVSLTLTADGAPANVVTFQMDFMPAVLVRPGDCLRSSPAIGDCGRQHDADRRPERAWRGRAVIRWGCEAAMRRRRWSRRSPFPEGKASAQTTVTTAAVTATTDGHHHGASGSGVTLTATLEIDPASTVQLAGLSVPPHSHSGRTESSPAR